MFCSSFDLVHECPQCTAGKKYKYNLPCCSNTFGADCTFGVACFPPSFLTCTCTIHHPRNFLLDSRFLFSYLTLFTYLACLLKRFDIYPQQCRHFLRWLHLCSALKTCSVSPPQICFILHQGAMTEGKTLRRETILWSDNRVKKKIIKIKKKPPLKFCFHACCSETLSWSHLKLLMNLWARLRVTLQKCQIAFI